MTKLLLNSLRVSHFRPFKNLQLQHLGRVNLIVGKNNVGKSSLLEAIWLYARRGSPALVHSLLDTRDETKAPNIGDLDAENQALAVKNIFYGRAELAQQQEPLIIGPLEVGADVLSLSVQWYVSQQGEDGILRLQPIAKEEITTVENPQLGIRTEINGRVFNRSLSRYTRRGIFNSSDGDNIYCIYLSSNNIDQDILGNWWDKTTLTDLERDIYDAINIISDDIIGISFVANNEHDLQDPYSSARIPMAKIRSFNAPVPLRSLGDGINRLFSISLALANTKNGILLIDEIENGIHYSVQTNVWRQLFTLARHLNVQIFATTHSWDCIEAFQKAAQENLQSEGLLIRLGRKQGEVVPTIFTETELGIITREQIEVR